MIERLPQENTEFQVNRQPLSTDYHGPVGDARIRSIIESKRRQLKSKDPASGELEQYNYSADAKWVRLDSLELGNSLRDCVTEE